MSVSQTVPAHSLNNSCSRVINHFSGTHKKNINSEREKLGGVAGGGGPLAGGAASSYGKDSRYCSRDADEDEDDSASDQGKLLSIN